MKKIDENIEYWLKTAEHDLETCMAMFDSGHYDWALYIGHLVLEKVIKANYISILKEMPPKTHDLIYLASKLSLNIEDDISKHLKKQIITTLKLDILMKNLAFTNFAQKNLLNLD